LPFPPTKGSLTHAFIPIGFILLSPKIGNLEELTSNFLSKFRISKMKLQNYFLKKKNTFGYG